MGTGEIAAEIWRLATLFINFESWEAALPASGRESVLTFDVIPLMPYSGFERLFTVPRAS
jgi:hypothetical protein